MKALVAVVLTILAIAILNAVNPAPGSRDGVIDIRPASVISSWYWLRAYDSWLEKDELRLLDHYRFATALDPGNLSYWRLAAQTLAFDLPAWNESKPRSVYGREALAFFEQSRPYFTNEPEWFQTGAFLAESAAGDKRLALDYLVEGIALDDFPYLLGRNYARLLIETDQVKPALAFLRSWKPRLESEAYPERQREIADWILSLEKELNTAH